MKKRLLFILPILFSLVACGNKDVSDDTSKEPEQETPISPENPGEPETPEQPDVPPVEPDDPPIDPDIPDDPPEDDKTPKISLSELGSVNIHTLLQQSYLDEEDYNKINNYAFGTAELSRPQETFLKFETENIEDEAFFVDVSISNNFETYKRYETTSHQISITNLELATTYYWRVSTNDYVSDISSFTTLDNGIRNLYVDGVTNVRDIGGYLVTNGTKRIKQGLILRSGRLNKSWVDDKEYQITEDGIRTMKEDLHIRSEIDLRRAGDGETGYIQNSVLGRDVNYFDCRMTYESNNFLDVQRSGMRAMFNALVDTDNLPAVFHCDIGTDRTGACAYILGALLGKSERDLIVDYLFSNFANIGSSRDTSGLFQKVNSLQNYDGETLQEKAISYLTSIGVNRNKLINFIDYCTESV